MLTSIPPALLHRVRDGAAYVHDLASLGLAILCPCDDDHGRTLRELGPDEHEFVETETEDEAPDGFCSCLDVPMRDCGISAHRAIARSMRAAA